jgi:hypothetical protein
MSAKERFTELGYQLLDDNALYTTYVSTDDEGEKTFVEISKTQPTFCVYANHGLVPDVPIDVAFAIIELAKEIGI